MKGEYPSNAPIGYVNKFPTIVPDPDRASFIQEIFSLYSSGDYSLKELSKVMFEKGFRSINGNKVCKAVINRILRNPEYYGVIRRKGRIYTSLHQGLIDKATFDLCQDILTGRSTGKKLTHNFLYRGYLVCAFCGCQYTSSRKKSIYDYYYCTNGKGLCDAHRNYLSQARVEQITLKLFQDFALDEEMANLSFEAYAGDLRSHGTSTLNQQEFLLKHISDTKSKLSSLLDLLLSHRITQERYDEKNKELEDELVLLELRYKKFKPIDIDLTLELVEKTKAEACDLPNIFDGGDDLVKADLLKGVLWNFSLKDEVIQSVRYKSPYIFLQNLNKTRDFETWRRGGDSNPR